MLLISVSSISKSSPTLCCWTPFTMRMALGLTDLPWWVTLWTTSPPGESPSAVAEVSAILYLLCPTSCPITSITEPSAPIQHHLEPFSSATASSIAAVRHNSSKSLKISFNNVLLPLPPLFFFWDFFYLVVLLIVKSATPQATAALKDVHRRRHDRKKCSWFAHLLMNMNTLILTASQKSGEMDIS